MYSKTLASNLKALLRRHVKAFEAHPDSEVSKAVPRMLAMQNATLYQFDDTITRLAGGSSPPFPLPSARDYYKWGSSHNLLGDVRVPFLALNAEDDPIVGVLPVHVDTLELSPWIVFATTHGGGHLAWFEQGSRPAHPRRWYRRPVLEWLKVMGEEVVHSKKAMKPLRVEDGWIMEEGRDDIGCKEISGGERVIGVEGEGGLLAGL